MTYYSKIVMGAKNRVMNHKYTFLWNTKIQPNHDLIPKSDSSAPQLMYFLLL